jgi:hypothetical protein
LSWKTQNRDRPGNYWLNSRDNLLRFRISAKSIVEQLGISLDRVGSIIREDLDMQKLLAQWVPKCLKTDKNFNGSIRLRKFWNFFGAIQMISSLARLCTVEEIWLYHYDSETKQQSTEWRNNCSARPQISEGKIMLENF